MCENRTAPTRVANSPTSRMSTMDFRKFCQNIQFDDEINNLFTKFHSRGKFIFFKNIILLVIEKNRFYAPAKVKAISLESGVNKVLHVPWAWRSCPLSCDSSRSWRFCQRWIPSCRSPEPSLSWYHILKFNVVEINEKRTQFWTTKEKISCGFTFRFRIWMDMTDSID